MVEGTTYVTSELSSDSEVSFQVSATNSVGEGQPSGCVSILNQPTVPSPPTLSDYTSSRYFRLLSVGKSLRMAETLSSNILSLSTKIAFHAAEPPTNLSQPLFPIR